ncbi:MAG: alpha/beta fold hydrolase [bacterium]|nr:alpha/beta fold hydrolase [bacterium]
MSPRPFERPATISLPDSEAWPAGASLEGLWLPARDEEGARGGAVMAPPHPLMGGSMDSPVATEVALAASDCGWGSLRFNWRGVGASAGSPSGEMDDADEDYRAALRFLEDAGEEETGDGPLLAAGYSWGSLAASRVIAESSRTRRAILVAPPPAMLDADALAAWGHPVLAIAGDRDEYVPLGELRAKLAPLENATLVELEGVDHFFMAGLAEVGRACRDWLRD